MDRQRTKLVMEQSAECHFLIIQARMTKSIIEIKGKYMENRSKYYGCTNGKK